MENKDILLSLVVPIFGVERYIHRFLNSIRKNLQENMEVILVDDGSKDNCGKIIDEFAEKYNNKYFIKSLHKVNGGVSSARNVGLSKANGEYVLFVDPDDCLDKECINEILRIIRLYNDVDMIIFDYYEQKQDGKFNVHNISNFSSEFIGKNFLLSEFMKNDSIDSRLFNKVIKRTLLNNLKFKEDLNYMEDYEFLTRVFIDINKTFYLKKALYYYFYNIEGLSKNVSIENRIRVFSIIIERYVNYSKILRNKIFNAPAIYASNQIILKYKYDMTYDTSVFEKYIKVHIKEILLNDKIKLNIKKQCVFIYIGIAKIYYKIK